MSTGDRVLAGVRVAMGEFAAVGVVLHLGCSDASDD